MSLMMWAMLIADGITGRHAASFVANLLIRHADFSVVFRFCETDGTIGRSAERSGPHYRQGRIPTFEALPCDRCSAGGERQIASSGLISPASEERFVARAGKSVLRDKRSVPAHPIWKRAVKSCEQIVVLYAFNFSWGRCLEAFSAGHFCCFGGATKVFHWAAAGKVETNEVVRMRYSKGWYSFSLPDEARP